MRLFAVLDNDPVKGLLQKGSSKQHLPTAFHSKQFSYLRLLMHGKATSFICFHQSTETWKMQSSGKASVLEGWGLSQQPRKNKTTRKNKKKERKNKKRNAALSVRSGIDESEAEDWHPKFQHLKNFTGPQEGQLCSNLEADKDFKQQKFSVSMPEV